MDRTISNNRPDGGRNSSPSSNSNIGLSLLERINRVLGKKKEFPSSSGDEKDSESDIEDDVSLLTCAKIMRLSHSPKEGYRGRTKNTQTQSYDKTKADSAEVLMIEDDEECRNAKDENIATKHSSPRDLHHISDEPEFPIALKRNTVPEEGYEKRDLSTTDVTSGISSKSAPMESLSFSKEGKKALVSFGNSATRKNMEGKELEKIEKKKAKEYERHAKNQARQEEKQRKLEEREAKKRKQDQEKNARKAASMTAKADSIDQCLKHVTAVLDSDVLTDGGGAILQSLESMGVQYEVKKLPCDATIGWMRNRVEYVAEESGQIKRESTFEEEDQILMRIKAADLARMMNVTVSSKASNDTLASYVSEAEKLLPNKKITVIISGMENYSKLVKAKSATKKQQLPQLPAISKSDLEDALFGLQLQYNCCVHFCESADDLAQMVCSFTKAVAERPYKKGYGIAFNVYMNNHEKGLPQVNKDGQGLLDVWVRQLQQFKGVGYDTAAAIVQKYPSPYLLLQEYGNCSSVLDGSLLLQDIEIRRGHGVLATSRRVGPELSRKIYDLLMSVDGSTKLAKS